MGHPGAVPLGSPVRLQHIGWGLPYVQRNTAAKKRRRAQETNCVLSVFTTGNSLYYRQRAAFFREVSPGAGVMLSGAPAAFGHLVETIYAMLRGSIGASSFQGYPARVILVQICPAAR